MFFCLCSRCSSLSRGWARVGHKKQSITLSTAKGERCEQSRSESEGERQTETETEIETEDWKDERTGTNATIAARASRVPSSSLTKNPKKQKNQKKTKKNKNARKLVKILVTKILFSSNLECSLIFHEIRKRLFTHALRHPVRSQQN